MTTTNTRTAQCVCAERGYCADVPTDPEACPVCRAFGTNDRCPADGAAVAETVGRAGTVIDEIHEQVCPTLYQVVSTLACPAWCELPADHDADSGLSRVHHAAMFTLGDRAHVSVCEVIFPEEAFHATAIEVEFWARGRFDQDEARQIHEALVRAFALRDRLAASVSAA